MNQLTYSKSVRDKALNLIQGSNGDQIYPLTPTGSCYKVRKADGKVYWVDWVGSDACECSCPSVRHCSHMMAAGIHRYQTISGQRREAAIQ